MFAIVEIAKAQHKVKVGDVLEIEKLAESKVGDKRSSDRVLLKAEGEKVELGFPYLPKAKVEFTVKAEGKGEKIIIFKKKAKKRFEKTRGHRQLYTQIEITAIK